VRIQEITAKEQFKPRIFESFDLTTQELYQHLTTTIHTEIHTKIETLEEARTSITSAQIGAQSRRRHREKLIAKMKSSRWHQAGE
jgi:hypothetical protein